ncbi:uncharacterized protein LOC111405488 [Olea europaea var. sylvestris]|uniref:uncharacterized protein LOC111405488 n=1 Tax=Olea europaea var. sylvestris TaxID=158386 RepID=UPI000C1CF481|nr:uncharacterized protein LOC111405488 [Olea europaea var. sylvestris]
MKFEDFLMQASEEKQTREQLEEEVEELQRELNGELQLNKVLNCALYGSIHSCSCVSLLLPQKVQVLLAEVALVEEEICWLERKINELKLNVYQEKKQTKEWELLKLKEFQPQQIQRQLHKLPSWRPNQVESKETEILSRSSDYEYRKYDVGRERRAPTEFQSTTCLRIHEGIVENSRWSRSAILNQINLGSEIMRPNKLSEELIRCLMSIYLNLNQTTFKSKKISEKQHSLNCINSKGFMSKTTAFSCIEPTFPSFDQCESNLDPYRILSDIDTVRDVGPYNNFIQITRASLDKSRLSECLPAMGKLRILMHKLSKVNITYFTYKQKLAFWINIYNACIMNAFLQHGLPSTPEKLLALMNEATINVGGIVLNALAIEHFILRHPADSERELIDEKEMLLRHTYGLGYPEPNVTFALCRGTWSSPALRIYTTDEVVNELERAKVEFLEASVGITSKKKILVPKLMQWHMKDFADDMDSLLEWIYSQLPHPSNSSLKRLIMECIVNSETNKSQVLEIQPYASEFRYLLPL